MPDLQWCDVEQLFDPDMMGFPTGCVRPEASVEDWQAVFDLIRSQGWAWEYREGDRKQELPTAAEVFSRPDDAAIGVALFWLASHRVPCGSG
ncbi:hypothetical protein [Nocardia yamanashiensis]|uniref:hypothetical protein n=1 Tax=Nocardia yamanashiensis TaxID=209247 RepID=UPI0008367D2F|nr:hypothetical protein [Nocardia yamanashiensis]